MKPPPYFWEHIHKYISESNNPEKWQRDKLNSLAVLWKLYMVEEMYYEWNNSQVKL